MTPEELKSMGNLVERIQKFSAPLSKQLVETMMRFQQEQPEFMPSDGTTALIMTLASHMAAHRDPRVHPHIIAHNLAASVLKEYLRAHAFFAADESQKQPAG